MAVKSKAYYLDTFGRVLVRSASVGLVGEAARGVQAILQEHPQCGWEIRTGGDYFIQRPDGIWLPVDINGLFDYLVDLPQVAFGRMLTTDEYSHVMTHVHKTHTKIGGPHYERKDKT